MKDSEEFGRYIGDGVYVGVENGMLRLIAGNNMIFLELPVWNELKRYADDVTKKFDDS